MTDFDTTRVVQDPMSGAGSPASRPSGQTHISLSPHRPSGPLPAASVEREFHTHHTTHTLTQKVVIGETLLLIVRVGFVCMCV